MRTLPVRSVRVSIALLVQGISLKCRRRAPKTLCSRVTRGRAVGVDRFIAFLITLSCTISDDCIVMVQSAIVSTAFIKVLASVILVLFSMVQIRVVIVFKTF